MGSRPTRNIVGPLIRSIRNELGWSQEQATARCNVVGFDISRATFAQIEAQIRNVTDLELALLAKALRVKPGQLLPDELPVWKGKGKKDTWKSRKANDTI
jgi:transcriptional regulator with XRE-family HTH domain